MLSNINTRDIIRILNKKSLSSQDVCFLMISIRKYMEANGIKNYLLHFYCDWILHATIDRNPHILLMFGNINRYLFDSASSYRYKGIVKGDDKLAAALQLRQLTNDISDILHQMTGIRVCPTNMFFLKYFRTVEGSLVIPKNDFPGKVQVIQDINEGNKLVNEHLKFLPSLRYDPNFDYSQNDNMWINNMKVDQVIGDTVIFHMYTTDDRTIIYELNFDVRVKAPFRVVNE